MEKLSCMGMNAAQEKIDHCVAKDRWAVIGTPEFTYTVGLHYKSLPEVIIFLPNPIIAQSILNKCATLMIKEQSAFVHGSVINDLCSMPMTIIDTSHGKEEYAVQAYNHYGHWDFALQQLVWPDPDGVFHWDNKLQPILGTL